MPIQSADIKLLKSAVMADTTDGGGAMTGTVVVDGQSNNLFPDTSEMDRALGRVNMRKIFGVAQTSDTATLLGAHAIVTKAPDDPLVHCLMMHTPGWGDTRATAKDIIERYLVKGPRITSRMMDTHYAGGLTLRLYANEGATDFPAGGDAIVLRNPNGQEQYIRVLRTAYATQSFTVTEGTNTVTFRATVVTCELGQALAYDFTGPPIARAIGNESAYALLYSTTTASGAKFYGVKPLSAAVAPGDNFAVTSSGIFTPLVPAATIETPIIDQLPLKGRQALISTALANVVLPAVSMQFSAGKIVTAPTPIQPGSVSLQFGASYTFLDDSQGSLKQGTLIVGSVDYKAGLITFGTTSPDYGTASATLTYKPATLVGASSYSSKFTITTANQGLAFTNVFEPPPAPGSFTLSYMAQGRWYVLQDDMNGKLVGSDSSYGVGTINYATGSMSVTLGALPDIGSSLIADWGDPSSAKAVAVESRPLKVGTRFVLDPHTKADEITIAWSRGATPYTASTDATGLLTGAAAGGYSNGVLTFQPTTFPDSTVTITSKTAPTGYSDITNNGGGSYSLTGALPITPGSFRASVLVTYPAAARYTPNPLPLFDRNGVIYIRYNGNAEDYYLNNGGTIAVGTINYATGAVVINPTPTINMWVLSTTVSASQWVAENYRGLSLTPTVVTLGSPITDVSYSAGTATTTVQTLSPGPWVTNLATKGIPVLVDGMVLAIGADLYTVSAGILRRGWSILTGAPTGADSAAGTVSSDGILTLTVLPANATNGVTWYNVAQDAASKEITGGVFRTASAPLKVGVYQMQVGANVGSANEAGVISGGTFTGTIDYARGVVIWSSSAPVNPAVLSYNAVFLQYLPLDAALLGLETARLPLDGKVPIYRKGELVVIHNTQTYALPNPLVKGTTYDVGRVRLANIKVKSAAGVTVPDTLYTTDLDAGTLVVPVESDLTTYTQPFSVEHRIEDMMLCSVADISGKLTFTRTLTHNFPANTSFASSVVSIGDVFARAYNYIEQATWTGAWSDSLIGAAPTANFNETLNPLAVTNRGAITERWAMIFTNTTAFRVVGETVGEIAVGNTGTDCSPINPATGVPYFTIPAAGWGSGWGAGNVYRFNTAACGAPLWVVRTVLQGPATYQDDKFTLAYRGDVDRP